jgi:hypothetical protein
MSPVDDTFLTSSADRTVRLWDLQQAGSLATMEMPKGGKGATVDPSGCPIAAFDGTGLVFGISAPLAANAGHVSNILQCVCILNVFHGMECRGESSSNIVFSNERNYASNLCLHPVC